MYLGNGNGYGLGNGSMCDCGDTCEECLPYDPGVEMASPEAPGLGQYPYIYLDEGVEMGTDEAPGLGFNPPFAIQEAPLSASAPAGPSFGSQLYDTLSSVSPAPGADIGAMTMDYATAFSGLIPVAGPFIQGALMFGQTLENALHVGAGRQEADVISPQQNKFFDVVPPMADRAHVSTNIQELQQIWVAIRSMAQGYIRFVLDPQFRDRRASGQSLNWVMPYVDGTYGYAVPLGQSIDPNTLLHGYGWSGHGLDVVHNGSVGVLGDIERRLMQLGGAIPMPQLTQGAGVPSLQYNWSGTSPLPQSGYIPLRAPAPQYQQNLLGLDTASLRPYVPLILGAAAVLWFGR